MRTNNSDNEDWWFTSIGGYGATDMLTSLYQADPAGQGCQSGTCTTIIEGFDGIPDKIVDQFTVTYGLAGKTGGAGTTTKASETTQAQNAITNTSTSSTPSSSTSTSSGSRSGYSTRHRRRSNRRRGYPSGNFGYKYTDAGYYDYWYDEPPIVIPVPVEVPVEVPKNDNDTLSTYTIPLAIVLSAMILVVGLKK